jgi:glycosyltransferase involved in cell wall biosynthesis
VSKVIAVDINPATRDVVTGTERYTRELCARLPAAAPDLTFRFYAARPKSNLGVDVTVLPFRRMWSQVRLPIALASERTDLLFVPGHSIPFAWMGRALAVVHDLAFERHPDAYTATQRLYLRLTTRWAVSRCRVLIAVSESTRNDLASLYGADSSRVRVVPHGGGEAPLVRPASASQLGALGLTGDFALQVGRVEARKNPLAALAAVERVPGLTLAVAGPEVDSALAVKLRASKACRVLGRVDDATLELLYKRAKAVVVPSLYEGFGLPVLEAMARGQVVVAARTSSLPEVGGDAVLYVDDPADAGAFASVLQRALDDGDARASVTRRAVERARDFTWDRCARQTADVIREALT